MSGLTVQNREMQQNFVPKEAIINGELVSELELILSRLYILLYSVNPRLQKGQLVIMSNNLKDG